MQPAKPSLDTPLWEYTLSVWSKTSFHGWSMQLQQQFGMRPAILVALAFAGHHQRCVNASDVGALIQVGADFYHACQNKLKTLQQKIAHYQGLGEEVWRTWNEVMEKTRIQAMQVELADLHGQLWKCPMTFATEGMAIQQNWYVYLQQLPLTESRRSEAEAMLSRLASGLQEASRFHSEQIDQALS